MAKNVRSEYIKNLLEDKKMIEEKMKSVTENTLNNILTEKVNEQLRTMLNEDEDSYDEEEVEDTVETTEETPEETDTEETVETEDEVEDVVSDDSEMESSEETDTDDVWGDIEQYKGEDGEYDLTGMDAENLIKVLKVMSPEDGVRVVKNDNGTVTLSDDETDKEYIIDIDGTMGGDSCKGEDCEENEFEIDIDESVNEENLGYTDNYQKQTAMTTPDNHEPADKSKTYSMDGGVPTGTEKPFAGTGNNAPFAKNASELEDVQLDETMTTQEHGAYNRGTGMVHTNTNSKAAKGRNAHAGGKQIHGTGDNSYSEAQLESIKRKANAIFVENKEMKEILDLFKQRLEEAIVINQSLGNVVKLVIENVTTKEEKSSIVERFKKVKTRNESNQLFEQIDRELKDTKRVSNLESIMNNQLSESKTNINEAKSPMYKSPDLNETIDFMARLNRIK